MNRNSQTTKIITIALFIAMEIILTRYLSINIGGVLRIGFGFLPVAMLAIMFGPIWAGIAYAVGDILGMLMFPSGPYFPGFTLTAFLTGLVFGLILYNKPITWQRVLIASIIVVVGLNLGLDTLWLKIILGKGYFALLPTRLIKCVFAIPIQTILIPLIWHQVFMRIPMIKQNQKLV